MLYNITNKIKKDHIKILKKLENKCLKNIFIYDVSEFALNVVLDVGYKSVTINNSIINQCDGDDYPNIVINQIEDKIIPYTKFSIKRVIQNIIIIREEVAWSNENHQWLVISDIGIKIVLEDREVIIVAKDSLAGFLKIYGINRTVNKDISEEYWSMKTNTLDFKKREEIRV